MILPILLALVLGSSARGHQDGSLSDYTGSWWLRQPQDVQIAYIAGYSDCYVSDVKGDAYPSGGLSEASATRITGYFRKHQEDINSPLAAVLSHVFARDKHPRLSKRVIDHGEYWPEKHGFFNGDYWHQLVEEGREPYVAGYLSCEVAFRRWHVTHPINYYVRGINQWYGINRNDEMLGDRGDDKIARVIERLSRNQR